MDFQMDSFEQLASCRLANRGESITFLKHRANPCNFAWMYLSSSSELLSSSTGIEKWVEITYWSYVIDLSFFQGTPRQPGAEHADPMHCHDISKLKYLDSNEQKLLLKSLLWFESLFDGTLGEWKGKPYHITLRDGVKPYHACV